MRGTLTRDIFRSPVARWAGVVLLVAGLCAVGTAQAGAEPGAGATQSAPSQSAPSQSAPQSSAAPSQATSSPAAPAAGTAAAEPQAGTQDGGGQNSGAQKPEQKSSDLKPGEAGADNGDIPRIRVGTNEVNVVFTVTDKHGNRVTDLKQGDFHFVDDNKPAVEIRSFHAETNLPLTVGLLIDASNSVRDRFKFEQESAIEFLNQTVRR